VSGVALPSAIRYGPHMIADLDTFALAELPGGWVGNSPFAVAVIVMVAVSTVS